MTRKLSRSAGTRVGRASGVLLVVAVGLTGSLRGQSLDFAIGAGAERGDEGSAIATDGSGASYVTGFFEGTVDFDPGPGTFNLTSGPGDSPPQSMYVARYDPAGNLVWALAGQGGGSSLGGDIVVDGAGASGVVGSFSGTVDFDPGPGTVNLTSADGDAFVARYDASGALIWVVATAGAGGGSGGASGVGLDMDATGNSYITGSFGGTVDFDPGPGTFNLTSPPGPTGSLFNDIFVAKYDPSGSFLWALGVGSVLLDGGDSIAVDGAGNSYVTGTFQGTADFDPGPGVVNLTSGTGAPPPQVMFLAKYDTSGNLVWARAATGDSSIGTGIGLDSSGNIYVTGDFNGTTDFDPGPGTFNLTAAGLDIFVAKYDTSGNFSWAFSIEAGEAWDIAVDGAGSSHVTGWFEGTVDFDPGPASFELSGGGLDIFAAKYDSSGELVWAVPARGSDSPGDGGIGLGIAVDGSERTYITGFFTGTVDFDPGPGTLELTHDDFTDIFVWKLKPNSPPLCDAGGPQIAECDGMVTTVALDGRDSSDPDPDDVLTFLWETDCPGAVFDDAASATPILTVDTSCACPISCSVSLTVSDGKESASCTRSVEISPCSPPDCSEAVASVTECWPPSHRFVPVEILGVSDPDGDPFVITITGITQDEPVKQTGRGSGTTCPDGILVDADGDGNAESAGLRCERDGRGNGRVYTVQYTATDEGGFSCAGSVSLCVPHDRRPGTVCVNDGQIFDSTVCPGDDAKGESRDSIYSPSELIALVPEPLFLRGDVDWDEELALTDGILIIEGLFQNGTLLDCDDAADVNDDGALDISDAIALLMHAFRGDFVIRSPGGVIGPDPSPDHLGCE